LPKLKKICFISSTRADYGLLKDLIKKFKTDKSFETKIIACGTHFSDKFGNTVNEIYKDSFKIDLIIKSKIVNDTAFEISNLFSKFSHQLNKGLKKIKPDLIIILGDRFEMLAVSSIATIHNIPICHIHGGEKTEGAIDDSIRHAITKLSSIHFVSHKKYKNRVIQMGENPRHVHYVGSLGLNSAQSNKFLSKEKIIQSLNIRMRERNFIVTYHPVTLIKNTIIELEEILDTLRFFKKFTFLITSPNMDTEHDKIISRIKKISKKNKNIYYFKSLGKENYFSLLRLFDGVIGNSSSGIIEVSSFKKGTINIGERQKGRVQPKSVINCRPKKKEIKSAIKKLISNSFQEKLNFIKNPYYKKNTENNIIKIIKKINLKKINKKTFFDYD
tara:strand:- start:6366 stop:7526 length:1161 start_codon:yes stop_codon:yes gene_type:complete